MTFTQPDDTDFVVRIPRANVEAAALGGAVSVDLNNTTVDAPLTEASEAFGGGVLTYALYQAMLTFFATHRAVQAGQMTRSQQFKQIGSTAWEACKSSAVVVAVISILLGLFPFLTPIASIAAIGGGFVAGGRLINGAMDAFSPQMKAELKAAAEEAGVKVAGLTDGTAPAPAAG